MMIYEYKCEYCSDVFEQSFHIGCAESSLECPSCGGSAKKLISGCNFLLKGGGWPGRSNRLNTEMTKRNEKADRRMRKEHDPAPTPAAYDYGGGDVREAS